MSGIELKIEVEGRFKLEAYKKDAKGFEIAGTRRVVADWFKNLILDSGLDYMASSGLWMRYCQVGSGSTPPAIGQTALVSRVASAIQNNGTTTTASVVPWYVAHTRVYSFPAGAATGNLSEVGIGWADSGTSLFSRSLIKDANGNPVSIAVQVDESLDVTYECRYYAPAEVVGTITATGNIAGTYNYVLRPALVTTASPAAWSIPESQAASSTGNGRNVYAGPIGTETGQPSGTSAAINQPTSAPYVTGSFALNRIAEVLPAVGNFGTGLRSMLLKLGVGCYQIEFTPPIPKTSVDVVQLTLRLSWGRRP